MHLEILSTSLNAETIITGKDSALCSFLKVFNNSSPLMSGKITSSKIKSGVFLKTSVMAVFPSYAVLHDRPCIDKRLCSTSQLVTLSSTIRISDSLISSPRVIEYSISPKDLNRASADSSWLEELSFFGSIASPLM